MGEDVMFWKDGSAARKLGYSTLGLSISVPSRL